MAPQVKQTTLTRFLPDFIYGANDGIITTFAIVAGVVGAALPASVVLILGFASLLADGFSMAASDYLSERTPVSNKPQMSRGNAARHGAATFTGFVLPGLIPLVAWLLPLPASWKFPLTVTLTLLALFIVGVGRALASQHKGWKTGLEMLITGSLAAAVAYGIGMAGSVLSGGYEILPAAG